MTPTTWTILVPTVAPRAELFDRLLGILLPQLDAYDGRVSVLGYLNHGVPGLGAIRDRMLAAASTEYVSFVDDDDTVTEDYVEQVMTRLDAEHPDHVGHRIEHIVDGVHEQFVEHSLRWWKWGRKEGLLFRDFTHIDPIRREIAVRGSFVVRAGRAEDREWVRRVRPHLRNGSESFIDTPIYHYRYSPSGSMWTPTALAAGIPIGERKPIEHALFAWHPDSD